MGCDLKIDQADRLFSIWVRLRDRQCVKCGSPVKFNDKGLPISHQNSHFKGRRKEGSRFMPANADTLCGGCHLYLGSQPDEHYLWQLSRKGQQTIDHITLQANTYKKKDRKLEAIYWRQRILEDFNIKV